MYTRIKRIKIQFKSKCLIVCLDCKAMLLQTHSEILFKAPQVYLFYGITENDF